MMLPTETCRQIAWSVWDMLRVVIALAVSAAALHKRAPQDMAAPSLYKVCTAPDDCTGGSVCAPVVDGVYSVCQMAGLPASRAVAGTDTRWVLLPDMQIQRAPLGSPESSVLVNQCKKKCEDDPKCSSISFQATAWPNGACTLYDSTPLLAPASATYSTISYPAKYSCTLGEYTGRDVNTRKGDDDKCSFEDCARRASQNVGSNGFAWAAHTGACVLKTISEPARVRETDRTTLTCKQSA